MTRCLSFHASYACRHAGACCTSAWPIPVEADRLSRMRAALATGALRSASPEPVVEARPRAPRDGDAMLATVGGCCTFYDGAGRRCRVHETLGHDALPLACRQFPRVSLVDPRGVSITLSHYCPTAAALLDREPGPVTIVETPAAFPAGGEYEGLDAATALPPLLKPDMLMDWESWWDWEARAVDLLVNGTDDAAGALARLDVAVEHARAWTPAQGPLSARVREAFEKAFVARTEVRSELQTTRHAPRIDDRVLKRLLAAHAFANWTMHLGQGLRTWKRSLDEVHALAQSGLDARAIDLQLRHIADPNALAKTWSAVER